MGKLVGRSVSVVVMLCVLTGCAQPDLDREGLKEELRREILAELQKENEPTPAGSPGADEASRETRILAVSTGNVRGKVLFRNRGLPDCRVRLIRLQGGDGILDLFSGPSETTVVETVTGPDGAYRFEGVPAGAYRIKWRPKGETGWIRRLTERPDLLVEEGRTAVADDFHAGRPLLDG